MKTLNFDPRDPNFYNPIINSNFDFWQRAGSTVGNRLHNSLSFGCWADRFFNGVSTGAAKSISTVRSSNVPSTIIPCPYSLQYTNNTAVASIAASEWLTPCAQVIEGTFYRPFAGQKVTFGFWLFSSVGGVVSIAVRRNTYTRSYITTVNSTPNVWEYHIVIIPFDIAGAAYDYSASANCIDFTVGSVSGTSLHVSALNTWEAGNKLSHPSATNWAATAGAIIRTAQWQVRLGEKSKEEMQNGYVPFAINFSQELIACQRYFEKSYDQSSPPGTLGLNGVAASQGIGVTNRPFNTIYYAVEKRVSAIHTFYSPQNGNPGQLWDSQTPSTHYGIASSGNGVKSHWYTPNGTLPSGGSLMAHWTADAEF